MLFGLSSGRTFRAALAAAALALSFGSISHAQTAPGQDSTIVTEAMVNEVLSLVDSELVRIAVPADPAAAMRVTVPVYGTSYELLLNPHSVRSPDYRVLVHEDGGAAHFAEPAPITTKRGIVTGRSNSLVAASASEFGLEAHVWLDESNMFFIEPVAALFPGVSNDLHVVYREQDKFCDDSKKCGVAGGLVGIGEDQRGGAAGEKAACSGTYIAELATEADYEYFQLKGSVNNVQNAINTIINAVNVQYERDVSIRHEISFMNVWTTSSDPYSNTTDPSTALSQFRSYWNSNMGGVQRDVAEMFTNKSWSGSVIGIAYLNGICNSNAYDVVRHISGTSCRSDLSAHELGHNWSAQHCSCSGYTMNPSLTCANRFSQTSITSITNYRNQKSGCLGCDQNIVCQADIGGGGPGTGVMTLCGEDLSAGTTATLEISGTNAPNQIGFFAYGPMQSNKPFKGGTLWPNPPVIVGPFVLNASGEFTTVVNGGGGPATIYLQAFYADPAQPQGAGITNVLRVLLP